MIPKREVATRNGQTYFVTSNTAERTPFFRHERWADLFVETLLSYRPAKYLLHDFTLMPDHFHALLTPATSLELAVQCVKGGFSFRARRAFAWKGEIWATGFSDHRIRDWDDCVVHRNYIARNPVKAGLVESELQYRYGAVSGAYSLDAFPQGLKPEVVSGESGAAEAAPFQSKNRY